MVHERAYHIYAKDGFQFLCLNGRFSKIRSHNNKENDTHHYLVLNFFYNNIFDKQDNLVEMCWVFCALFKFFVYYKQKVSPMKYGSQVFS